MGSPRAGLVGVCLMVMAVMANIGAEAILTTNFYDRSCPQIFSIVKREIKKAVAAEARMAASLVRLHFHDCFVNGCDGSLLLDNSTDFVSEKFALANVNSARGFEVIDTIKAALEDACPQTVSCADILAIVSRDSAVEVGFVPNYPVFFGRRDSLTADIDKANLFLPSPFVDYADLKKNFSSVGLNELDLVALSGAHTIGRVKCAIVRRALQTNDANAEFRDFLNTTVCPEEPSKNISFVTDFDLPSPDKFDNNYYKNLRRGEGMITSDQTLQSTPGINVAFVADFANNQRNFFLQFAISTIKMGSIDPLQGDEGEIRVDCRKVNPTSRVASQ